MEDKPAERPRMIFDCPERYRRAIKFREARTGLGPSDVILKALDMALVRELQEADEAIAAGDRPPRSKRGRKPKAKGGDE